MRLLAAFWIAACVISGANVLYDAQTDLHGSVDPIIGTDGPQFRQWLEDNDD